jgi:hypothetical protein
MSAKTKKQTNANSEINLKKKKKKEKEKKTDLMGLLMRGHRCAGPEAVAALCTRLHLLAHRCLGSTAWRVRKTLLFRRLKRSAKASEQTFWRAFLQNSLP